MIYRGYELKKNNGYIEIFKNGQYVKRVETDKESKAKYKVDEIIKNNK